MNYWIIFVMAVRAVFAGTEPEYLSIYRRIPQHYLKAMPQKVFEHTTVETCARSCVTETEFECKSFDYDNGARECHLYNHTHREPLIGLQESLDVDHYRTAYEKLFNRIPNHVITMRHKRKISGLRVEECARRCILELTFRCAGFDYGKPTRVCFLTEKIPADVGGLKRRANTDYYERKTNGPLSRFINYGYGSLQTVEGVQTHTKIVLGVNLDACAQLCLAETAFTCASFDYVFGEQSCQLSKYVAAHVHGMRTEFAKRYHVMHFELLEENLNYFYPTPYSSILGRNDKTFRKVTPDTCAKRCLEEREFVCRSFDYQIQKGTCLLSHVTGSDAGGLYVLEGVHVHHFEMKPSLDCGGLFRNERGTVASPNWPRHYSHHLNCTWSIHVPEFKIVKIEIHHIDLGDQVGDKCSHDNDVLSVRENTKTGLSVRCVQNYETEIITRTNNVNVTFTTNAENDAKGFRLFYHSDWPCEGILTADNGEFASPRWPNKYPALSNCRWTIKGPPHSHVTLRFGSIELEDHTGSNCKTAYDKIDIYDGDSSSGQHLTTVCGYKSSLTLTSSGNSLFVSFISDNRVQAKGFHVSYRFLIPTTTSSTSTTTTVRPSPSSVLTSFVSRTDSNITVDNPHSNNVSRVDVDKVGGSPGQTYNHSVSVHLAMTSNRGQGPDPDGELNADFDEPTFAVYRDTNQTHEGSADGKISDDIGMGIRPDIRLNIVHSEKPYTVIIWGVVLSLCTTCVIMTVVILFVCRYYRRRLPKLRQRSEESGHPDENLSLCQKDGRSRSDGSMHQFPDEEDIDDSARLPLPRDHEAPTEVEFHNPLYVHSPEPNRPRSLVRDSVSMATISDNRDFDIPEIFTPDSSFGHSGRHLVSSPDSVVSNSLSDINSSVLTDDTTSTALLLEERTSVRMDCFTTV